MELDVIIIVIAIIRMRIKNNDEDGIVYVTWPNAGIQKWKINRTKVMTASAVTEL